MRGFLWLYVGSLDGAILYFFLNHLVLKLIYLPHVYHLIWTEGKKSIFLILHHYTLLELCPSGDFAASESIVKEPRKLIFRVFDQKKKICGVL